MEFLFANTGSFIALLIALALLWWAGQGLFNVIWMFFPFKPWRITDVTHLDIPLPEDIATNQFEVEMLDFLPAGMFEVRLTPLAKTGQYTRLYTAENYEAYAEVTQISAMNLVGFFTLFPDNALIMTTYPYGENIQTPMFHQRYAANSLDAAYYHHMKQVERWRELHGNPILLQNADEIHAAEGVYRQHHRRRHFRRLIAQQLASAATFLSILVGAWAFLWQPLTNVMNNWSPLLYLVLFFGFAILSQWLSKFPESVDDAKKVEDGLSRDL